MRGYAGYNFDAFLNAGKIYQNSGYGVLNPAQMDLDAGMPDPREDMAAAEAWWVDHQAERMGLDIELVLSLRKARGDLVIALPGWQTSTGARAEIFTAMFLGIEVYEHDTQCPIRSKDVKVAV
jgi:hypothetical protein